MKHDDFLVPPGTKIRLKEYDPESTGKFKNREDAAQKLEEDVKKLAELQDVLYAQNAYAVLLIFQALDAAGKDSVIKHVMSGINPQGCQVYSFKAPSAEELEHDFLWRTSKAVPERGRIGIFNRSYYEEVLVVKIHPEFLDRQNIPKEVQGKDFWKSRYEDINNFERHLAQSGTIILKFYLNVSKQEQKKRFMERIERPEKNWKFSMDDLKTRAEWDKYMEVYEEMFNRTSTEWAPWHIIPADRKWFTRAAVADVIVKKLKSLNLRYPEVSVEHRQALAKAKQMLESE